MESIRFNGLGDPRTSRVARSLCRLGPKATVIFESPDMNWNDIHELMQTGQAVIFGFQDAVGKVISSATFTGDVRGTIAGTNWQTFAIEGMAEVRITAESVDNLFSSLARDMNKRGLPNDPVLWLILPDKGIPKPTLLAMRAVAESDMLTSMYTGKISCDVQLHTTLRLTMEKN